MMTTLTIDGVDFALTLWDKVPGSERVYIRLAGGKEYGYWDVSAGEYVRTGKAFPSASLKDDILAAAAQWAGRAAANTPPVAAAAGAKTERRYFTDDPRLWGPAGPPSLGDHLDYLGEDYDEL